MKGDCDVNAMYLIEEVELFGAVKEFAQEIDEALEGADAGQMIFKLREKIDRLLTNNNFFKLY